MGLSTRVLPHNFVELLQAQIAILDKKPFQVLPDFPQGGLMDAAEYEKGTGRVRLRARIEEKGDKTIERITKYHEPHEPWVKERRRFAQPQ